MRYISRRALRGHREKIFKLKKRSALVCAGLAVNEKGLCGACRGVARMSEDGTCRAIAFKQRRVRGK